MIRTSGIRHPERDLINIRHNWQVEAITNLYPGILSDPHITLAAELLSIFEHDTFNRSGNKILAQEIEQYFVGSYSRKGVVFGPWLPYVYDNFMESIIGRTVSLSNLKAVLESLETIRFISTKAPDDIHSSLKFPHRIFWIKLEVDTINAYIDGTFVKTWAPDILLSAPQIQIKPSSTPDTTGALADALCEYHRHVLGKSGAYLYHTSRRLKVMKQLKQQYRYKAKGLPRFTDQEVIGRMAQVIIGNSVSPFHKGLNDKNKIYDDIDLMFRDSEKVEHHIDYAIEFAKCTWEMAYKDFVAFTMGTFSNYSQHAQKEAETVLAKPQKAYNELTGDVRLHYNGCARAIVSFFLSNTPIGDIMEFMTSNPSLRKFNKGITNPQALIAAIEKQAVVYKPEGLNEETKVQVSKFSANFCRLQQINIDKQSEK